MINGKLCYSELQLLSDFDSRYDYLKVGGSVGEETFGNERWLNQIFYRSSEWKSVRDRVIIRDNGYDLGCLDRPIFGNVLIHHMNPITPEDIRNRNPDILDPEFLISCSLPTHNAIHYGDGELVRSIVERRPNDTCPWKQ